MAKTIIDKIAETSLILSGKQLERNSVHLRGFITTEPSFIYNGKMATFEIVMIHKTLKGVRTQKYSCFTQATNIIESLLKMQNVCYVDAKGTLRNTRGHSVPMIMKFKVLIESSLKLDTKEK